MRLLNVQSGDPKQMPFIKSLLNQVKGSTPGTGTYVSSTSAWGCQQKPPSRQDVNVFQGFKQGLGICCPVSTSIRFKGVATPALMLKARAKFHIALPVEIFSTSIGATSSQRRLFRCYYPHLRSHFLPRALAKLHSLPAAGFPTTASTQAIEPTDSTTMVPFTIWPPAASVSCTR